MATQTDVETGVCGLSRNLHERCDRQDWKAIALPLTPEGWAEINRTQEDRETMNEIARALGEPVGQPIGEKDDKDDRLWQNRIRCCLDPECKLCFGTGSYVG